MHIIITGIGTDIIEINRVAQAAEKAGDRFLNRVFTPQELSFCLARRDPWPCLAARFAAKEAVFKALGTGLTTWHDVEVTGGRDQPPAVTLTGAAKEQAAAKKINTVLLSIAHDRCMAVAFATAIQQEVK